MILLGYIVADEKGKYETYEIIYAPEGRIQDGSSVCLFVSSPRNGEAVDYFLLKAE